ncbi:MAG: 6-carboxytetrahydropterin synthase QueD [Myxococcota bacterium]
MEADLIRTFRFEAAHRLPKLPPDHKCSRIHGHSFRVEIVVRGPIGEDTGWVMDFADVKEAWRPLHDTLDHNYLNEVEGLDNPTSERIAVWIWERLVDRLPGLRRVTVMETCTARVSYEGR